MRILVSLALAIVFLSGAAQNVYACMSSRSGCSSIIPCCSGLVCDKTLNPPTGLCVPIFGEVGQPYGAYGAAGLGLFLNNVVAAIMVVAGILLFLYLVFGGLKYMMAGGDEKAVDSAKRMLTNAAIGLIIVVSAWFIAKVLETVLGIHIFNTKFTGP